MRVQLTTAMMIERDAEPCLYERGDCVQVASELGQVLVQQGLATAVKETTEQTHERSRACTQFQRFDALRLPRLRRSL